MIKRFPHAEKGLKNRLMKQFEDNVKHGETMQQGRVSQRKLNGHITGKDLLTLEKIKNEFFPDYEKLKQVQAERRMQHESMNRNQTPECFSIAKLANQNRIAENLRLEREKR